MSSRITLDLDTLVADGRLTPAEAERLRGLAMPGRAVSTMIQVLYVFGALGLAAGVMVLKPDPISGMVLAAAALGFASWTQVSRSESLSILGYAMAIAGTAGLSGSLALQFGDQWPPIAVNALVTAITLASALWFRSAFLAAFVPLGIAAMVGSGTQYWHAAYGIFVQEPTITVVLFGAMALGLFAAANRLKGDREHQATVAGRVAWMVMNFGFWVGSLWGDHVGEHFMRAAKDGPVDWDAVEAWRANALFLPDYVFVVAWAAASLATIALLRTNRFALNSAITFLAINGYTQFFERFGNSAVALLTGGVTLLAFAFGLYHFDRWAMARRKAPA